MRSASLIAAAIVLAMVGASFGAILGNVTAAQSGVDSFGYVYTDSKAPLPSVGVQWIDISTTGTDTTCAGDDDVTGPFPIGFDFTFYGNRYSAFNVTTNGYIMFGTWNTDWGNDDIPNTNTPNNFIAAYWDDMYADSGEIIYQTVGVAPDRQLVVEYMNVTRLGYGNLMTFEIVLNETRGDIWVNYLTVTGMTGSAATEGIENIDGTTGVQYGYNAAVITDSMSIRYSLPEVMIGPSQTLEGGPGATVSYTLVATNNQAVSDSLAITYTSFDGWAVGLYDDVMNPLTDTDADGIVDTGTLAPAGTKTIIVTVTVPGSPAVAEEYTYVSATAYSNPLNYFTCTLTTDVLPGWLEPPHSDYGDDANSDGLYDYLIVDVSVGIFTPGWFTIEAYLRTTGGSYISYDGVQLELGSGMQTMQLQFYGWDINEFGADGPYNVHLTLYDGSWNVIDTDIHATQSYTYDEFMLIPGEFAPPHSDYGVDTDSDGLYDLLQVDVNLNINCAGRFLLTSYLFDDNWNNLAYQFDDITLSAGSNTIALLFDAWDVSEATVEGAFYVSMTLQGEVDGSIIWLQNDWHTTADYLLSEFERPDAIFFSWFSDWGLDLDSDFLFDFLIVEVGVNVTVEGDYVISAELEDWWGDVFLETTNVTHLTVGDHYVQVSFPGWPIRYHGESDSFDIHMTITSGSLLLDEWDTSTNFYWWSDFETAPGWIEPPHSDTTVDADADLLYDYLIVNIGVNVTEDGAYRLDATLYDDWWNEVEQVSNTTALTAGWNSIELRFTGWLINQQGNDGVFYVDLEFYDSGARLMSTDTYTTASYLYTDFEGVPALFGSPHDSSPINDDADVAYERLVIYVAVEVYTAGKYLIDGTLLDSGWSWVSEVGVWADLDVGTQTVELSFPGWLIYEYGVTGVFHVNLELMDANMHYLDWDSHTTASLEPTEFDTTPPSVNSNWASSAPAINGMVGAGEWADAAVIDIDAAVPIFGFDAEMRIMNDADSLYILIDAFGDMTPDEYDYASIAFDTGNDAVTSVDHEDQFVLRDTSWWEQAHYVYDTGGWVDHCSPFDHDGLYGGEGFSTSPTLAIDHRIYEFAIPLALLGATQGDTLGFVLRSAYGYGLYDDYSNSHSEWPIVFAWTPELVQYADLVLAENLPVPPPVTTAAVSGTAGSAGWYKSATTVTLSATGGDGGVDYTEYRIAGGSWVTYTAPFVVSGDGTHTYEFRSVDNAAQIEATKTLIIKIDTVAPVSASEVSDATVWLNATDGTSGVGSVMYRIDGGSWATFGSSLSFAEAGTYVIDFYALDVAGNQEATKSVTVVVEEEDLTEDDPSASNLMIYIGIGAIVAIVAVLLVVMLLMKRRKGQQPDAVSPEPPPPA